MKRFLIGCLLVGCVQLCFAELNTSVLEMTGRQAEGARPDIVYLAPKLSVQPKAYTKVLATTAKFGTVMPHAYLMENTFCSMGPLSVLSAAGYRILPIRDVTWQEATDRLVEIFSLRKKTRYEDGLEQEPLCVILSEEVSPEGLEQTLPQYLAMDALLFLAPQDESLPLTVIWENYVWPTQRSEQSLRAEHWVATLSEIVGIHPPAATGAVSVLPLLSGSGYQRPLEQPLLLGPSALSSQRVAPCTMVSVYTQLPEHCPWVPDFTDQSDLKPTERFFVASGIPLAEADVSSITDRRSEQGLYVRTVLSHLEMVLPPKVSCVVRVKGSPVFSVWQPEKETTWYFDSLELQIVEFFLMIPPKVNPIEALPFLFVPTPEA